MEREAAEIRAQNAKLGEVKSLPWDLDEGQSIIAGELMEKVLEMSLDERNFIDEVGRFGQCFVLAPSPTVAVFVSLLALK